MTKNQYIEKRQDLISSAEECIKKGNLDSYTALETEIKNLDAKYEEESRAEANLKALSNSAIVSQTTAINSIMGNGIKSVIDRTEINEVASSSEYENAFTKVLMGKSLSSAEQAVFSQVNASDTTTKTNSYLVPTTWVSKIWSEAEEIHTVLADVTKTSVPGDLDIPKAEITGSASFYDEDEMAQSSDIKDGDLHLKGYELAKTVTVSWKMQKMAVADFQSWLRREIVKKVSGTMASTHFNGLGVAGSSDGFKSQPLGIITALKGEVGTPQVLEIPANDDVSYISITYLISLVNSAYAKKSKFYANSKFIWRTLANIVDKNGKPIFASDPTGQAIGRIFGYEVAEEDAVPDDKLVFGNFADGYTCNVQQDITLYTQEMVKARKTDYMAYTIYDSQPITTKAFALLEKKTS